MDESVLRNDICERFHFLDCTSEKLNEGYFVVEILFKIDYKPVKQKVEELKNKNIIDYATPVLSDKHQY